MKIMISPAKKIKTDPEGYPCRGLPAYLSRTEVLKDWIRGMSFDRKKALWACNEKIAEENEARFAEMDLHRQLTQALLAYDGIQYTSMGTEVLEQRQIEYLQEHLRILSGFYGILKPLDGVVPYRLEMHARGAPEGYRDLYDFWGDALYREMLDESRVIVNLASREYAKCVEKYLTPEDRYVTCLFGELENGRVVQKGVYAKMARGDMVRYLAETGTEEPEQLKGYDRCGYRYDEKRSTETTYVFIRTQVPGGRNPEEF